MEKSYRRAAICVWQKGDPGHDHLGLVCRSARWGDGVNADFCRSNPPLRTGRSWLDAGYASDRRLRNGAGDCASAANETRRQSVALVRLRLWNCNHSIWFVESILVIARAAMSRWSVRQR